MKYTSGLHSGYKIFFVKPPRAIGFLYKTVIGSGICEDTDVVTRINGIKFHNIVFKKIQVEPIRAKDA
jgi:hypothetical protein